MSKFIGADRLGYINSFICRHCRWGTLTVNLNTGFCSDIIGCNNPKQNVVDGIVDTAAGNQEGSPQNPHAVFSFRYEPQSHWISKVNEVGVDANGIVTRELANRMFVERAWIRPTMRHIKRSFKRSMHDEIVKGCRDNGFLILVNLTDDWEKAPDFDRFGMDDQATIDYLNKIYR